MRFTRGFPSNPFALIVVVLLYKGLKMDTCEKNGLEINICRVAGRGYIPSKLKTT